MQCKIMHHMCDGFKCILENSWHLNRETDFLTHFKMFFLYAFLCPMSYVPTFCQIKDLLKTLNRLIGVSFISIAFIAVKLKMFIILYPNSASMKWPCFEEFLPELIFKLRKTVFEQSSNSPWRRLTTKKKNFSIWLSKYEKSISPFREKCNYFLPHLGYFLQETGCGHTFKGQNLTYPLAVSLFLGDLM